MSAESRHRRRRDRLDVDSWVTLGLTVLFLGAITAMYLVLV